MKEDQLTPWFPAEVKPVHVGPYLVEIDGAGNEWFSFFDGDRFGWWSLDPEGAYEDRHADTLAQVYQWRGLRSKP